MTVLDQPETRSFAPGDRRRVHGRGDPPASRAEQATIDHAIALHALESVRERPQKLTLLYAAAKETLIATPAVTDPLAIAYKLKQIASGMELSARRFDERMARQWVADRSKTTDQRYLASAYLDLVTLAAALAGDRLPHQGDWYVSPHSG